MKNYNKRSRIAAVRNYGRRHKWHLIDSSQTLGARTNSLLSDDSLSGLLLNRSNQDPAGNWTTQRPPDDRKETQTAVVWSCFPFVRSGQNHLARHSERGKKTRQTEGEVGRQHQGEDRPGVRQVPEGNGEQGKMEKTVCKIIYGAPTTLAVKGLMIMMMMMMMMMMSGVFWWRCVC